MRGVGVVGGLCDIATVAAAGTPVRNVASDTGVDSLSWGDSIVSIRY